MSGGRFNYVCFVAANGRFHEAEADLNDMLEMLDNRGKLFAASAIRSYIKRCEALVRQLEAEGDGIYEVLKAVEWWACDDINESELDRVVIEHKMSMDGES